MYSKNKGSDLWNVTPPPGYDGSRRFGGGARSDGRDEGYAAHTRPIYRGRKAPPEPEPSLPDVPDAEAKETFYAPDPFFPEPYFDGAEEPEPVFDEGEYRCDHCPDRDACKEAAPAPEPVQGPRLPHALGTLFSSLARDDLLLIALVILLSGEKNGGSTELLLLLALLLLAR